MRLKSVIYLYVTCRIEVLEAELRLASDANRRSEAARTAEIERAESEVTKLTQERKGLLTRLKDVEVVEDAVRELYVHMVVSSYANLQEFARDSFA